MSMEVYQRFAREREMEATVRDAVALRGGIVFSVRDSRGLAVEHMPDLIIILPPRVFFLELKSQRRVVTPGQRHTLDLLADCDTILSGIMRPVPRHGELSLDDVLRLLAGDNPATGTGGTGEDGR